MERLSGSVVQSSANKGSHLRRPRARHRRGAAGRRAPARSGGRFVEYQPTSEASVNRRGISQPARHQSTGEASVNRRGISQPARHQSTGEASVKALTAHYGPRQAGHGGGRHQKSICTWSHRLMNLRRPPRAQRRALSAAAGTSGAAGAAWQARHGGHTS
jgi:hypothetical protein